MKTYRVAIVCGLIGMASASCVTESSSQNESIEQSDSGLSWDDADLHEKTPLTSLPSIRFDAQKNLKTSVFESIFTGETLSTDSTKENGRTMGHSEHFSAEWNPFDGSFQLRLQEGVSAGDLLPAVSLDADVLQADSLALVANLGIPAEEIGQTFQRTIYRQNGVDSSTKELDAHITMIDRAIGGIPVVDSRLVVAHDPEGHLVKVGGYWPTIANSGHKLATSVSIDDMKSRLTTELTKVGVAQKKIRARYVYVPQEQADGTVQLVLNVEGRVMANGSGAKIPNVLVEIGE